MATWRHIDIDGKEYNYVVTKCGNVIIGKGKERKIVSYCIIKNLPLDYDVKRAKWKGYFKGVTPGDVKAYLESI